MNRKVTLLLLAAVTAILPAVAVADVMITGQVNIVGTQNTPAFYVCPGPNYLTADQLGSIELNPGTPYNPSLMSNSTVESLMNINLTTANQTLSSFPPCPPNYMATVDLQGISTQTTVMGNVLSIAAYEPHLVKATFSLYFTGNFPPGTTVYVTSNQLPVALYPFDGWNTYNGEPLNNGHFTFNLNHGWNIYYVSFVLPPGYYQGDHATMTGVFSAQ